MMTSSQKRFRSWTIRQSDCPFAHFVVALVVTAGVASSARAQEFTVAPAPGLSVRISTHNIPATDWQMVSARATVRLPGREIDSPGIVSGFRCSNEPVSIAGRLVVPVVIHNDLSGIIALDIEPDCSILELVRVRLNLEWSSDEILRLLSDNDTEPFTYDLHLEHSEDSELWLVRLDQVEFLMHFLDRLMAFSNFGRRLQQIYRQFGRHASSVVSASGATPIQGANAVVVNESGQAAVTVHVVSAAGGTIRDWGSPVVDTDAPRNCPSWYQMILSLFESELPLCLAANALDYTRDNFDPVIPRQIVVATCRYHPEESFMVGELNDLSGPTQVTCPVDGCSAIDHASFSFH